MRVKKRLLLFYKFISEFYSFEKKSTFESMIGRILTHSRDRKETNKTFTWK